MTAPRRVVIAASDLRTLTGAELFTCLAWSGLTRAGLTEALSALQDPEGDPGWGLRGMRFLQGAALVLQLRDHPDPRPTWEEAMEWDVTADLAEAEDPLEADRLEYRVAAAIATGLSPQEAELVPVAEVEAFARRRAG